MPEHQPPQIQRVGKLLFVATPAGLVEIRPSHDDRARPRWWSGWLDGRRVTTSVPTPRIVAALALKIAP